MKTMIEQSMAPDATKDN
uniref:Uncharacterized protein n=1 Tax=Anguilla anguilla TaxID=7936 RepID=A0A0E9PKQ2_ANGAN